MHFFPTTLSKINPSSSFSSSFPSSVFLFRFHPRPQPRPQRLSPIRSISISTLRRGSSVTTSTLLLSPSPTLLRRTPTQPRSISTLITHPSRTLFSSRKRPSLSTAATGSWRVVVDGGGGIRRGMKVRSSVKKLCGGCKVRLPVFFFSFPLLFFFFWRLGVSVCLRP